MSIKIFGHMAPDTDATASAIIWAWYNTEILQKPATPYVLGELNPETAFVLDYWQVETPALLQTLQDGDQIMIVDTNNAEELPANLENTQILQIVDHHRLMANIKTSYVTDVTIRLLASTATVMNYLMGETINQAPDHIKGLMLSCVLSDTLAFRSPTTTDFDRETAEALASDLDLDLNDYADQMFAAKSDVSAFSDQELLTMDSKKADFNGKTYRVGVLETAKPEIILDRKAGLLQAQSNLCDKENLEQAFLFVIDILREEAILLIPNEATKDIAEKSFNCQVDGDTVVLPGILSRKKQIIPALQI